MALQGVRTSELAFDPLKAGADFALIREIHWDLRKLDSPAMLCGDLNPSSLQTIFGQVEADDLAASVSGELFDACPADGTASSGYQCDAVSPSEVGTCGSQARHTPIDSWLARYSQFRPMK